jgi:hypothetical protein
VQFNAVIVYGLRGLLVRTTLIGERLILSICAVACCTT